MKIWKKLLSGYQSPMLVGINHSQEVDEGYYMGSVRRRNARKPLLRIAGDTILDDLLIMETRADGKSGKKGERGEGRVGDDNPAGGKRDGGKLSVSVARHGRG
jgi:hypothetical protein